VAMEIIKIPISKINPALYNPRVDLKPGDPEYEKLKKSIATFGYVEPLVWNKRTGTLISGHQRLKVLIEEGFTEVEVSVVDLPLDKEKTLNIALNKIRGSWDEEKLVFLLEELKEMPNLNLDITGFDLPEVSELLDSFSEIGEEDDFDPEKDLKSIKEPITKKGDLIELGPHRILCGDSSNIEDLKHLFKSEKADLVNTDPPYNVNYYGGNRPHPNGKPKDFRSWERICSDNMSQEQYEVWLNEVFTNMSCFLKEGSSFYIWNGHRQFGPMHHMLDRLDFNVSTVITWAKPNFAISYGDYNQQTEFCLYGWKKGASHSWHGPTNETSLWEIKRDPTKEYVHPTQKPLALAQRAMRNSSQRSDIVLDLFLGSGSTLIAAESLGRRCFGLEMDPKYCDVIVRRYIAFVGIETVQEDLRKKYLKEA